MLSAEILSEVNAKTKAMANSNKARQNDRRSRVPKRKARRR